MIPKRAWKRVGGVLAWSVCAAVHPAAPAQQSPAAPRQATAPPLALTAQDYRRAERWLPANVAPLIQHTIGGMEYLPDGRVFYIDPSTAGTAYVIADPVAAIKRPAFDHAQLAQALSAAGKRVVDAAHLGITGYTPSATGNSFSIETGDGVFNCDPSPLRTRCTPVRPAAERQGVRRNRPPGNTSPDGALDAFVRADNLWVRATATGVERQLTFDGIPGFGYATDNAGWTHSDAAILTWSADGKKIATFQQDQRKTGMMYLVPMTNRHPALEAWHYPLVGDKDVTMIEPVVIDVAAAKTVRLKMPPDQHRSMECDDVSCRGDSEWTDVEFSKDDLHLGLVSTGRDHKDEWLRVADTATGYVREVYHERVPTYFGWQSAVDWKYLPASNEFLWVSERSDWAQLYLYDLNTGALKNQITHGDGPVADVKVVDEANRVIYFTATGKEKGDDPYFRKYYRVDFDGSHQTLLTPEPMDHAITASPNGKTFVDVASTIVTPQTATLRDNTGKLLLALTTQDISKLLSAGWKPPSPFTVKARDGVTDLYGILMRPTGFDPARKYPVVDSIYPGPQDGSCLVRGPHSFEAARGDDQALADLGFVVLCLDGMGNPHRSKTFHDAHAARPEDMGDDTVPDQVAGITQLAARFPWIDAARVGIWGHSGGGNATVSAMFHAPDFFTVGWAESGNHDNRAYEDDWDERWAGLEAIGPNGKSNYDTQANQNFAQNLKGHLMLVHGTMDDNVPPSNTLLVADALIKANKDFDLLMIPDARHGYGAASNYVMRRRWDYFVTWLAGSTPPAQYKVGDEK